MQDAEVGGMRLGPGGGIKGGCNCIEFEWNRIFCFDAMRCDAMKNARMNSTAKTPVWRLLRQAPHPDVDFEA